MAQNRSSAVMEQRVEPHDSLDDFATPSWATRALMEHVILPILAESGGGNETRAQMKRFWTAREPCANRGYMVRPLEEYFRTVIASDIFDYGQGFERADYLFPGPMAPAQFIIMNPPYKLGLQFINKAFDTPCWAGAAAFVRTSFAEGADRYARLYKDNPPTVVAHFVERVICTKGIVRDPNELYWDPEMKNPETGEKTGWWRRPSTATSYCWMYWQRGAPRRPNIWIPPCRREFERRPDDYPPVRDEEGRRI